MFENLEGEVKKYAEVLINRTVEQLEVMLSNLRKPKYWDLSRDEAETAIKAAIEEKKKMAVS